MVITYQNVRIGTATDNAFQLELFKTAGIVHGDIAVSYPVVSAAGTTGVIGLSNGQLEGLSESEIDDFLSVFSSSDFSLGFPAD